MRTFVKMKNLFYTETVKEIEERLLALNQDDQPEWGVMNSAQMLAHCCGPLEVVLEEIQLKKPGILTRLLVSFYKPLLYNDKPWKKGLPTTKEFRITEDRDFEGERLRLLSLINRFVSKGPEHSWPVHPLFGTFSSEQWGMMQYKHLDHHLKQFGK